MEYLLTNLWWAFVTVTTLVCVTIGTVWILQTARNKYLIVYKCVISREQKQKLIKRNRETQLPMPADKKCSLLKRVKSSPIEIQDPYYVRDNRTRRRSALGGVCKLATIREEYTPFSYLYNPIIF